MGDNKKGDDKKIVGDDPMLSGAGDVIGARFGVSESVRANLTHTPVLLKEVVRWLNPRPGGFVIDGTLGGGGHATSIIRRIGADGKFLGIDWDERGIEETKKQLQGIGTKRFVTRVGNYANLLEILKEEELGKADGLLLDLGFSSDQLVAGRGFSFNSPGGKDEPLIMTYNSNQVPAYDVLHKIKKEELIHLIREFSNERYARRIAEAIIEERRRDPIVTSGRLAEVIRTAVPKNYERGRIDAATRTFQAIRMHVNDELGNLEKLLESISEVVRPGGRVVVISFHSKEDRMVKHKFRDFAKRGLGELLTKKPITATVEEIKKNPRSRSAKLRAIKII